MLAGRTSIAHLRARYMNMYHSQNGAWLRKPIHSQKTLFQCHSKHYMNYDEPHSHNGIKRMKDTNISQRNMHSISMKYWKSNVHLYVTANIVAYGYVQCYLLCPMLLVWHNGWINNNNDNNSLFIFGNIFPLLACSKSSNTHFCKAIRLSVIVGYHSSGIWCCITG